MIRALVSIEIDLASSYTIRYACQLGNLVDMEIHPVYVKGYDPQEPLTGVGWVRRTWEKEIVREGRQEIAEMMASEIETCPTLTEPLVIYGDREPELMRVMAQDAFDLYVEGAPYPFNPAAIHHRLHQKFYQRLNCPLIWLRGVRPINQALLLCLDVPGTRVLTKACQHLWGGSAVPLHLGFPAGIEELRPAVGQAEAGLTTAGCRVTTLEPLPTLSPATVAELQKQYGLVVLALERDLRKDHAVLEWLPQVKAPLMIVLR
jgi:hypothetical protein